MPTPTSEILKQIGDLIQTRQFDAAEQACLRAISVDPADPGMRSMLAAVHLDRGEPARAVAVLRDALRLMPNHLGLLMSLATAQYRLADLAAARATLEQVLRLDPGHAVARFHLGLINEQGGEAILAVQHYRHAIESASSYPEATIRLGLLLQRMGRAAEALPVLECIWQPAQPRADIAIAIARAHLDLGQFDRAMPHARIATTLSPRAASAWMALGIAQRRSGDAIAARDALSQALAIAPDNAMALAEQGINLIDLGAYDEGLALIERARVVAPHWHLLRWLADLALPVLADVATARTAQARFDTGIDALIEDLAADVPGVRVNAIEGLSQTHPFYLHYLPLDTTASTKRYGMLVDAAMRRAFASEWFQPLRLRARASDARRRIGFLSCELRLHTVTRYFSNWITGLDADVFEVHAWHLGAIADPTTSAIAAQVHHFHHLAAASVAEIAASIRAAELDVLIYLDIGMEGRPQMLAAMRLAPVQCLAYGHPVTSGLSQIDWFISGDAMEPDDASRHYSERLERLPGLGVLPARPVAPGDGSWLPREQGRPLLLCLQSLFKLTPDFDTAIAQIAQATDAKIVLFDFPACHRYRFRQRAAPAFAERGLDIDRHVVIEGRRAYATYLGGIAAADLILDSIGFSGGATSLDAIACGTPAVTLEGDFMRGRQTAAMLRICGVEELIAQDLDAYVRIAIDLCRDAALRDRLRARLTDGASRLFDARETLPALAAFLRRVTDASAAPGDC